MQTGGTTIVSPLDPVTLAQWQKYENLAKHLLTQCIPDSTALCVQNLPNIVAMWKEIMHEYTEKGAYVQTDLHTKFLESKCPAGGDIYQFLDELCAKCDKLSENHHLMAIQAGEVAEDSIVEEEVGVPDHNPHEPTTPHKDFETESSVPDLLTLSKTSYNDDSLSAVSEDNDHFPEVGEDAASLDDPDWTSIGSLSNNEQTGTDGKVATKLYVPHLPVQRAFRQHIPDPPEILHSSE
ncbi:hypothetical protein BDR06DRAFT_971543 [Suillus hirtellus]|nr:hypothetical protein BDR06DRAFT_971543 [Suillus hirtellus]